LIDTATDGDGLAAVEENGWWPTTSGASKSARVDRWKNYYIGGGNNVYISETQGPNGLKALPNFSGIEFTFGITIPKTVEGYNTLAYAKLPFAMGGFYNYPNVQKNYWDSKQLIRYTDGNNWDASWHEKYSWSSATIIKGLLGSNISHGTFSGNRKLKFKTHV